MIRCCDAPKQCSEVSYFIPQVPSSTLGTELGSLLENGEGADVKFKVTFSLFYGASLARDSQIWRKQVHAADRIC